MHAMKMIAAAALFSVAAGAATAAELAAEWATIKAPDMPALQKVTADPKTTALLVMDFMKASCTEQARPRCVATVAPVKKLLDEARAKGVTIIYTVTGNEPTMTNFLPELAAKSGEPIYAARADKFLNPDLDKVLKEKGIKTVIPVGTAANGAVLYTASGAAYRNYDVLVPVDGMSGSSAFSEQVTAWQLLNGPGLADRVKLTKTDMISF
ncbi:MAG: cysteine hydrolase [Hyphomicrobiales bacterium]|nr:cysteine hydrolase [Hyphomicrobiales bacterium]